MAALNWRYHVCMLEQQYFSTIPSPPKSTNVLSLPAQHTLSHVFFCLLWSKTVSALRLYQPVPYRYPLRRITPPFLPKGQTVSPDCWLSPPLPPSPSLQNHGILVCYCYSSDIPSVPHSTLPYAVYALYFKLSRQAGRVIKCEVFQDKIH